MTTLDAPILRERRRRLPVLATWPARIGIVLSLSVLSVALIGPFFAPYSPSALVGIPFSGPSAEYPLGTDLLGRDVLSRVLDGGYKLIAVAAVGMLLGYIVGTTIGLVAGNSRTVVSPVLMRAMDVQLAFPPLLFLLVAAAAFGPGSLMIVGALAVLNVPSVARIIYAAALEMSVRGYVEAAVARGQPLRSILVREILPNITGVIAADIGPRLTGSILLVAGLNFLGLGLRPPTPDWASMISENREGLTLAPWSLVAPALLIAVLTVGLSLVADAIARSRGTSIQQERLKQ